MKEYTYSGNISRGGVASLRPQLWATIFYGGRSSEVFCLVDSGSDHTLINAEFADILGIDLSQCPRLEMSGVAGPTVEVCLAEIRVTFSGFEDEFKIKAKFVRGMATDVILGQSDFFEEFKIKFEKQKRKFYLEKEK